MQKLENDPMFLIFAALRLHTHTYTHTYAMLMQTHSHTMDIYSDSIVEIKWYECDGLGFFNRRLFAPSLSLLSLSGRLEHLNSIAQNNNNTTTIIIFINTLFYPQHFGQESGSQLTTKTTIALYLFHTRSHSMRSSLLHGNKHD